MNQSTVTSSSNNNGSRDHGSKDGGRRYVMASLNRVSGRAPAGRLAVVAACMLAATAARGEGAVRTLDCELVRLCDAAGTCADDAGAVVFQLEPADVAADGSGAYRLSYRGNELPMTALSATGPFVWSVGDERHTLIASSDREFLWHQLTLRAEPDAIVRFLVCRFSQ